MQMEQVLMHQEGTAVSPSAALPARLQTDNPSKIQADPYNNLNGIIRRRTASWTSRILLPLLTLLAALQVAQSHKTKTSDFYELRPGQTERGQNITHILNSFFTKGYDKRVRPNYGGPPVKVGVSMQIVSISAVSEVQMDFTSDFYFRQSWRDERLSFPETNELSQMTVGAEVAGKIWVPDTFFANEKTAYFHIATTPNTFLRIGSDGDVYRSIRLTVTASCPMDLRYFPMDRQSCTIEIESFGYTMSDIRYSWRDGEKSVGISEEVQLPQFKIQGHVQKASEISLSTGNYSRLICEIRFVRSMGYYLIQIYVPAGLIVVISWVFASLLEYAAVGYLGKRVAMRKSRAQQLARFQDRKRQQRVLRQLGPSVDEMSPENDPLLTKNYNFNFTAQAPWGGGATAPTPSYRPSTHQTREHSSAHQRDRTHLDGRKTSHMSLSGGGHLNPNGRERDAVSGGLKLHHTEASLKHAHHNAPHPLQEGGNKSHYYHGAKHYLLVDKNKNTYSQDQNKVDEIEKQIRSEHYSSSNPGGGTQLAGTGSANLNMKLNSVTPRGPTSSLPTGGATISYYNTINSKHLLGERQPQSNHNNSSNLNIMSNANLINSNYNMTNNVNMFNMNMLDNHYNLNVNNYLNQQMNSLNLSNLANGGQSGGGNGGGGGGHNIAGNNIGPPPSHYATMPLPTHHREGRSRLTTIDHLNNSIINPLAMDEMRLGGLNQCDSKVSRKASLSPDAIGGGSIGGGALLSPGVESVLLQNPNKLCGVNPSDIDKYSRVVFPVCFVCFNLMYWVIYMRISDVKYAEPTVLH
ncbi:gamma-aminobutyric acid receptor subunit beta-like isoform X3 [Varroa destructor]|uniref:Gamma-aminobutyric acid receptor subunit beta n=1 Tax=Varroa destructor TaxID=109461 RepID=A0A7M7KDW4_VARDE|nr:gamma-aminobutyric acid receptor subunit beta-like isoform X3 [Varroa destructor]